MSNTIGTILVKEHEIILKTFDGEQETWEESKSLINIVGIKFIRFEGKKYYKKK